MGTAFEGTVVLYLKISESLPAHQPVGEFKRTVLDEFAIQTSVGGVVDVFKKESVHGRLYGGSKFFSVDVYDMYLCCCGQTDGQQ